MLIPYFPNPFSLTDYYSIISDKRTEPDIHNLGFTSKYQFVNNASLGINLLLKSFGLEPGSKVGLSPLICNSVTIAILKAGFTPYFFDINNDYISEFKEQSFNNSGIRAYILPHLYGAMHPQTVEIVSWCRQNNVFLISDTAQSFGLTINNLPAIELGDGGVYSFGSGKASSCAGGGIVYNLNVRISYLNNPFINMINNEQSKYKLASRTYGLDKYKKGGLSGSLRGYLSSFTGDYNPGITRIQFNAIKLFLKHREEIQIKRNINSSILQNNLDPQYFIMPGSFSDSLKFKYIFSLNLAEKKKSEFISAMRIKGIEIHNCSHTDSTHTKDNQLSNYEKLKNHLLELSTESSIPEKNFNKAADIMNHHIKSF
ncbi:MAG: DegT/DnrJ/EryC1/StrS family aminotransferase [Ignavibacteriaceae bacterium]